MLPTEIDEIKKWTTYLSGKSINPKSDILLINVLSETNEKNK